jgi:hypothetical protein
MSLKDMGAGVIDMQTRTDCWVRWGLRQLPWRLLGPSRVISTHHLLLFLQLSAPVPSALLISLPEGS